MKKILALSVLLAGAAHADVNEIPAAIISCTSTVNELPAYDVTLTVTDAGYQVNTVKTLDAGKTTKEWAQYNDSKSTLVNTEKGLAVKVELTKDSALLMSTQAIDGKSWTADLNLAGQETVALVCSHINLE